MRLLKLMVVVFSVVAAAAPSGATEHTPVFNTERVYFHCGTLPKANAVDSATYAWDATKPTTSYTANGGCGQLDVSPQVGDEPVFTGTHTGNIDRLTVHAWVIDAGLSRTGAFTDVWTQARLLIDGEEVAAADDLKIVPQASSTGISRLLEFSVTHIGLTGEDQAGKHTIELHLGSMPYDDGDNIAWVLDATELDSGITFSPAALATTRVRAN